MGIAERAVRNEKPPERAAKFGSLANRIDDFVGWISRPKQSGGTWVIKVWKI